MTVSTISSFSIPSSMASVFGGRPGRTLGRGRNNARLPDRCGGPVSLIVTAFSHHGLWRFVEDDVLYCGVVPMRDGWWNPRPSIERSSLMTPNAPVPPTAIWGSIVQELRDRVHMGDRDVSDVAVESPHWHHWRGCVHAELSLSVSRTPGELPD